MIYRQHLYTKVNCQSMYYIYLHLCSRNHLDSEHTLLQHLLVVQHRLVNQDRDHLYMYCHFYRNLRIQHQQYNYLRQHQKYYLQDKEYNHQYLLTFDLDYKYLQDKVFLLPKLQHLHRNNNHQDIRQYYCHCYNNLVINLLLHIHLYKYMYQRRLLDSCRHSIKSLQFLHQNIHNTHHYYLHYNQ